MPHEHRAEILVAHLARLYSKSSKMKFNEFVSTLSRNDKALATITLLHRENAFNLLRRKDPWHEQYAQLSLHMLTNHDWFHDVPIYHFMSISNPQQYELEIFCQFMYRHLEEGKVKRKLKHFISKEYFQNCSMEQVTDQLSSIVQACSSLPIDWLKRFGLRDEAIAFTWGKIIQEHPNAVHIEFCWALSFREYRESLYLSWKSRLEILPLQSEHRGCLLAYADILSQHYSPFSELLAVKRIGQFDELQNPSNESSYCGYLAAGHGAFLAFELYNAPALIGGAMISGATLPTALLAGGTAYCAFLFQKNLREWSKKTKSSATPLSIASTSDKTMRK